MRIRIGGVSDLPSEGQAKEFDCEGRQVCVARVNGRLSAMDNACPHRGGPLGGGVVDDGKLICPWHGWQFDPASGKSLHVPGVGVTLYGLVIEGDEAFVDIPS